MYNAEDDETMKDRYGSLSSEEIIDYLAQPGDEASWNRQLFMIRNADEVSDQKKPYDWNEDFDRR